MVPEFKCFIVDLPDFFIDFTPNHPECVYPGEDTDCDRDDFAQPNEHTSKSLVKVVTSTPGMLFGV